jgi:hypothetical protein
VKVDRRDKIVDEMISFERNASQMGSVTLRHVLFVNFIALGMRCLNII